MIRDRITDLHTNECKQPSITTLVPSIMPEDLKEPRGIGDDIQLLIQATEQINLITDAQRNHSRKESTEHVEKIAALAHKKNMLIKNNIINLKLLITNEKSEFKRRAFTNVYNLHTENFQKALTKFHDAVENFHDLLRTQSTYHLKTVRPDLTEEEVQNIIKNDMTQKVIEQSFVSDKLEKVVIDIESRHQDILRLEQQIQEIYELTRDFALLVDLQQESLNVIDSRIKNSGNSVKNGSDNLVIADHYSQLSQKRMIVLCCCVLLILCVILFPLLLTSKNF